MIRADSILNTASTAWAALTAVTSTHQSSRDDAGQTRRGRARPGAFRLRLAGQDGRQAVQGRVLGRGDSLCLWCP